MRYGRWFILLLAAACGAALNGDDGSAAPPSRSLPFVQTHQGDFDSPFAMAFLADGRLLVTEKAGRLIIRARNGAVRRVGGVPRVRAGGQGGLLDVALAPDFAVSRTIYLSYSEPRTRGSSLALARATLDADTAMLSGLRVIWRQGSDGEGGQFGSVIAFSLDHRFLFLGCGERQRKTPAQDPDQALGKIVRLTLDGAPAPGNPAVTTKSGGSPKSATARLVRAATWSTGHRNPYGLAFANDGRLWETEMGPMGGDELNLILPGRNYGWPNVSDGDNYDGTPIPRHRPGDGYEAPRLFWNPSISPGGFMIYAGAMFPQWRGSGFIAALSGEALIRVTLNGDHAAKADRWPLDERIRDVAEAPDGAIWLLEDGGALIRLTPRPR